MGFFSKLTSNKSKPTTPTKQVTWKCRKCGRTVQSPMGYVPGSGVGGPCTVVNGKAKPHEWQKLG